MSTMREVTENDFRKDEFKGKKTEDYEFRGDGKILRKDRWKVGMFKIASILEFDDFEIEEVIDRIQDWKKDRNI